MKIKQFFSGKAATSFSASLLSILAGLVFGLILLFCINAEDALYGFSRLITAGFSSTGKFAKVLYQAAPLIMTGLSVGFAFKTGLFNIGASGQYTVGAFAALLFALQFKAPWYVCMLVAMVAGALWGAIPGFCKAFFNVNEVITAIMFNWIGLFVVNLSVSNLPNMLSFTYGGSVKNMTAALEVANPDAIIPKLGLDKLLDSSYMNISIFIAIAVAVIMWILLSKTTFGYELKACGYNKHASIYAGISAKKNIILSMVIAGALAGIGGGIYFLSGTAQYSIEKVLLDMGFNGISVALLALSNPIGTIFSAIFISYIQVGGEAMQPEFQTHIIDIIIAVIIYLSAFSLLMRNVITRIEKRKKAQPETAAEPVTQTQEENALPSDNTENESEVNK